MVSLRSVTSFAVVLGLLVACNLGSDPAEGTKGGPGALCASNDECASGFCRVLDGYCGKSGCNGDGDCPAGWTCETSRGDPIFGFGGGSTFCQPSCAACPVGTGCEASSRCETLEPIVTVKGDPPRVGVPASLELVIDARGLPSSNVSWKFQPSSGKPAPTPSAGSGTNVNVTFSDNGQYALAVTIGGPGTKKTTGATVQIAVCGDAGSVCHGGPGECCDGECALRRNVGARDATVTCVARCPATCAPGHSCRDFDRFYDSSLPTGTFCLPDPPVITIDYAPKAPTIDQPVTFTSTASSPAGLKIVGYRWFIGDSPFEVGTSPTLTQTFGESGSYEITLEVSDDANQRAKQKVTLQSCVPAGESCFGGGLCCAGLTCTNTKCE